MELIAARVAARSWAVMPREVRARGRPRSTPPRRWTTSSRRRARREDGRLRPGVAARVRGAPRSGRSPPPRWRRTSSTIHVGVDGRRRGEPGVPRRGGGGRRPVPGWPVGVRGRFGRRRPAGRDRRRACWPALQPARSGTRASAGRSRPTCPRTRSTARTASGSRRRPHSSNCRSGSAGPHAADHRARTLPELRRRRRHGHRRRSPPSGSDRGTTWAARPAGCAGSPSARSMRSPTARSTPTRWSRRCARDYRAWGLDVALVDLPAGLDPAARDSGTRPRSPRACCPASNSTGCRPGSRSTGSNDRRPHHDRYDRSTRGDHDLLRRDQQRGLGPAGHRVARRRRADRGRRPSPPRASTEIVRYYPKTLAPWKQHLDDPTRFVVAGDTVTVEIHFSGHVRGRHRGRVRRRRRLRPRRRQDPARHQLVRHGDGARAAAGAGTAGGRDVLPRPSTPRTGTPCASVWDRRRGRARRRRAAAQRGGRRDDALHQDVRPLAEAPRRPGRTFVERQTRSPSRCTSSAPPTTAARLEFDAVDVIDIEGGRITRLTNWYDTSKVRGLIAATG